MVADIAGNAVPQSLLAARDALAGLKTPRPKTEAEQKLDAILHDLKSSKGKAAEEAARRKLERLKVRLEALKLAAGSAAAAGDATLARKVAKEIRDAARELGRALAAAGGAPGLSVAGVAPAASKAADGGAPEAGGIAAGQAGEQLKAAASGDSLAGLKAETLGVLKELKKVMRKLRETGLHPGIAPKARAEMEKMFAAAERELAGLHAVAAAGPGMAVDLVA